MWWGCGAVSIRNVVGVYMGYWARIWWESVWDRMWQGSAWDTAYKAIRCRIVRQDVARIYKGQKVVWFCVGH